MAIVFKPDDTPRFADKAAVRQWVAELNARMGFVPDPTATPEKVRELMAADGIRAEENTFSRELLRMRYEEN